MRIPSLLALSLPLCLLAASALADDVNLPLARPARHEPAAASSSDIPQRGETMAAVQRSFGAPSVKHAAVGGGGPQHPPITRWDYAGFSVFFEYSHVIDTVVPDQPPQLFNADELKPVSS